MSLYSRFSPAAFITSAKSDKTGDVTKKTDSDQMSISDASAKRIAVEARTTERSRHFHSASSAAHVFCQVVRGGGRSGDRNRHSRLCDACRRGMSSCKNRRDDVCSNVAWHEQAWACWLRRAMAAVPTATATSPVRLAWYDEDTLRGLSSPSPSQMAQHRCHHPVHDGPSSPSSESPAYSSSRPLPPAVWRAAQHGAAIAMPHADASSGTTAGKSRRAPRRLLADHGCR